MKIFDTQFFSRCEVAQTSMLLGSNLASKGRALVFRPFSLTPTLLHLNFRLTLSVMSGMGVSA